MGDIAAQDVGLRTRQTPTEKDRRLGIGFQIAITASFVAVVLCVGLALVFLSFDRAKAITRTAALTSAIGSQNALPSGVDGQFKAGATGNGERTENDRICCRDFRTRHSSFQRGK